MTTMADMSQADILSGLKKYYTTNQLHGTQGGGEYYAGGEGGGDYAPTTMDWTGLGATGLGGLKPVWNSGSGQVDLTPLFDPNAAGGQYGKYYGTLDASGNLDPNSINFMRADRGTGGGFIGKNGMTIAQLITAAMTMGGSTALTGALGQAGIGAGAGAEAAAVAAAENGILGSTVGMGLGDAGLQALNEVGMQELASGTLDSLPPDGWDAYTPPETVPPESTMPPGGDPNYIPPSETVPADLPTPPADVTLPPEGIRPATSLPVDAAVAAETVGTGSAAKAAADAAALAAPVAAGGAGLSALTTGSALGDKLLGTAGSALIANALSNPTTAGSGSGSGAYGSGYGLGQIPILTPYHSALQGVFHAAGGGMVPDAQNLSNQGRGSDSMLVHMTPGEVSGLQSLAQAHGTSLTTNPQTGLPEAGVLSNLLPALLGGGLSAATGMDPWMSGAIVGGATGLATGSLRKGLMAGIGAYGGAGFGSALEKAGAASSATQDTTQAAINSGLSDASKSNYTSEFGLSPGQISEFKAPEAAGNESRGKLDNILAGLKSLGSTGGADTMSKEMGPNGLAKYGIAALAPAALGYLQDASASQGSHMPAFNQYPSGRMPIYNFNMNASPTPVNGRYFNPTLGYTGRYYADGGTVATDTAVDPYSGAELYAQGGQPAPQQEVSGLLKGPGDGVSDSIPAQLDTGAPARLATGEFVVPARIVSELGNGDTEAGAKKLYAMMDRIQAARARTNGDNVARDSKAGTALPA